MGVAALVLRDAAALLEETRFLADDVGGALPSGAARRADRRRAAAAGAERAAMALAEMDER